jgi:dTMP kinase
MLPVTESVPPVVATVPGRFISFEGVDGAGKSTQIATVRQALESRGIDLVCTREPGGTALGESLRELLLTQRMDPLTETLMMFAARREHWCTVIEPALARGQWVLSDRFTDASYAYQGGGRGVSVHDLDALQDMVLDGAQPHLTILVDLSPAQAQERRSRVRDADRFEQESLAFFDRVRSAYLARAWADPDRFLVLNGEWAPSELATQIIRRLDLWAPTE